ncbi:hypothetical protein K3172_14760 [Qipengyuania sp. 6B39]|uniref:hypothetical protein n=1 Tax=Qipengyuania proteolytica TaxID=2867239 RepID=UPI001C899DFE|nr:hypothetical protein [Qipengyuania proteolytica]MBX7497117.1 hypothetical protein [Qipengyuania proteolytica]
MPGAHDGAFTSEHAVTEDGSVTFACSQDFAQWPWAALHPHHPGPIQSLSYWASVECAMALGTWDPDKWSALTWTRWACGEPQVGSYASGTYRRTVIEGKESFSIDFADAKGRHICRLDGRGVIFRTRDFETWRSGGKDAAPKSGSDSFIFADDVLLDLAKGERPFLAPLSGERTTGLIDAANGMPPGHPWLDGSGDHVNSAHLAEAARQFASLVRSGEPFRVTGAEMTFRHYVELGSPFEVERTDTGEGDAVGMVVRQSGRDCTSVTYSVAPL